MRLARFSFQRVAGDGHFKDITIIENGSGKSGAIFGITICNDS